MLRCSGYTPSTLHVLYKATILLHALVKMKKERSFNSRGSNDRNANLTVQRSLVLYAELAHWHF